MASPASAPLSDGRGDTDAEAAPRDASHVSRGGAPGAAAAAGTGTDVDAAAVPGAFPERTVSAEELALHATSESCWIVIHGGVYDVSTFHHPGGNDRLFEKVTAPRTLPPAIHTHLLPSSNLPPPWIEKATACESAS
jgi:hypothetical protein